MQHLRPDLTQLCANQRKNQLGPPEPASSRSTWYHATLGARPTWLNVFAKSTNHTRPVGQTGVCWWCRPHLHVPTAPFGDQAKGWLVQGTRYNLQDVRHKFFPPICRSWITTYTHYRRNIARSAQGWDLGSGSVCNSCHSTLGEP